MAKKKTESIETEETMNEEDFSDEEVNSDENLEDESNSSETEKQDDNDSNDETSEDETPKRRKSRAYKEEPSEEEDSESSTENETPIKIDIALEAEKKIKDALLNKKLIIGQNSILKALRKKSLNKVFVASNISKIMYDELKHYCNITKTEIEQLKISNEEFGILCKKQYLISSIGIAKNE